jgi:hypothetical protein
MRVVSHPEADEELEAASLWYEERQPGLGGRFPGRGLRRAGSAGDETDLAPGRQIRRQAPGAQALPEGLCQRQLGGSARPVIEPSQAAATGEQPESEKKIDCVLERVPLMAAPARREAAD